MARFTAKTDAQAVISASRSEVWDVLVSPELVAQMTPFLRQVDAEGDHWTWNLTRIPILGLDVAPSFTERMVFRDQERIDFHHDPPAGRKERTGVEGWYELTEVPGGTRLFTRLHVSAELPLPRLSSPAVTVAMKGVMATMGDRFSKNLLAHLGARVIDG